MTAALAGLRVIDLSTVLAGPNCARYLADFGADVIKVERPGGDSLRNMAWRDPSDGEGLWWKLANRNKRTVVLDLKDDADRHVLWGLIDDADVLIENFRPGTLERLGFAPNDLWARRPTLVVTRVSGFGQTGPYAQRPGFATIAEAMSGSGGDQRRARWSAPPAARSRSPTRPPGWRPRSPRWWRSTPARVRWSTSTCWRRCSS